MNISDKDLQILKLLLGEELVEEFLRYLDDKKKNHYQVTRNRPTRVTKKYVVDVSNFSERDLIGYWDYDECYFDDELYFEPSWFIGLHNTCRDNPYQQHVVVFKGIENASDRVYQLLKKLSETGSLCDDFSLPSNASYAHVELPPRKEKVEVRRNNHRQDEDKDTAHWDNPFDYTDYDVLR